MLNIVLTGMRCERKHNDIHIIQFTECPVYDKVKFNHIHKGGKPHYCKYEDNRGKNHYNKNVLCMKIIQIGI